MSTSGTGLAGALFRGMIMLAASLPAASGRLTHGSPTMNDVTRILSAMEDDDPTASSKLLPLVYDELRKLAAQRMARERCDHPLQPTALVHEAYVRLVGDDGSRHWNTRGHFFAA